MGEVRKADHKKQHLLFIGAHPDDADIEAGGTAIKFLQVGHQVTYIAMTNGDAGHHTMSREALKKRRYEETQNVAQLLGLTYIVRDTHDTELQATLENRHDLISLIRKIEPTVIITHRPNDYHADHRNTSLLVQDAAYLVAVPHVCADTHPFFLNYNPVILFHQDNFKKPSPFDPTLVVDITDVIDRKMKALACHESQVFEWLPWIEGDTRSIPAGPKERIEWLKARWGHVYGRKDQYLEAFEVSEYGGKLTRELAATIFPFANWVK